LDRAHQTYIIDHLRFGQPSLIVDRAHQTYNLSSIGDVPNRHWALQTYNLAQIRRIEPTTFLGLPTALATGLAAVGLASELMMISECVVVLEQRPNWSAALRACRFAAPYLKIWTITGIKSA
jgi:hypothetical protein